MIRYAIAKYPTPVLSTPDFQMCFGGVEKNSLPLDSQQLLRPIETVLFPNSKIELLNKVANQHIWQIQTQEYPFPNPLYIDERFVAFVNKTFPERKCGLPSLRYISTLLKESIGSRYIWGGNWPQGIPQLFQWYAPSVEKKVLSAVIYDTWQLKGVDCSGLLYYASNGYAPRNTDQLVQWGLRVPIEGKGLDAILHSLLPLDLLVWKGHVVIVLDFKNAIESKEGTGVVLSPLKRRLQEILQEKKPVDQYILNEPYFVIRRWLQ